MHIFQYKNVGIYAFLLSVFVTKIFNKKTF